MKVHVTPSPSLRLIVRVPVPVFPDWLPPFGLATVHTGVPKLSVQPEAAASVKV